MPDPIWLIIPAAGIGERFGANIPKQYFSIHGKTILEHTLERFIDQPWVEKIFVALAADDNFFAQLGLAQHPRIQVLQGGESRAQSVFNALQVLAPLANPHDWVMVHDAVRPCIQAQELKRFINALRDDPDPNPDSYICGGFLATPASDTIKRIEGKTVTTLKREGLVQALTPQMFRYECLVTSLSAALASQQISSDEAACIESQGYQIKCLLTNTANPKLTWESDLPILSALLNRE